MGADSRNNLYAATTNGLYLSPDGGHFWVSPEEPSLKGPVTAVALDPSQADVVYAAAAGTLFRSTDAGRTWDLLTAPINTRALDLAVDGSDSRYVYCACQPLSTFFRSMDKGSSWESVTSGVFVNAVAVYAGGGQSRVYIGGGRVGWSDDMGRTWEVAQPEIFGVIALAAHPSDAQILYATLGGLRATGILLKSEDRGQSWRSIGAGLPVNTPFSTLFSVVLDPERPNIVYVAGQRGVFKSTSGGDGWIATSLTETVGALTIDPRSTQTLYATVRGGVARSDDGGATWIHFENELTSLSASAIVVDPRDSSVIYAGTRGEGVFRSGDRGASWIAMSPGLTDFTIGSLATDPSGERLYAGTASSGVFTFDIRRPRSIEFRPTR